MFTSEAAALNSGQIDALRAYGGIIVGIKRLDNEPSNKWTGTYAVEVTFSTGWVVKVGQYGAVLSEVRI